MSIKNHNPSLQNVTDLAKAIEYNTGMDQLESWTNINTTGNMNCSSLGSSSVITSNISCQSIFSPVIHAVSPSNGVYITGELVLTQPKTYVNFYTSMMKAVYASESEKDQEFCMPTTKSKVFLSTLINHLNEEDAEKLLRLLYLNLKDGEELPELPSKHITTAIIEYSVKENL